MFMFMFTFLCTLRYAQVLARDMGVSCFVYLLALPRNSIVEVFNYFCCSFIRNLISRHHRFPDVLHSSLIFAVHVVCCNDFSAHSNFSNAVYVNNCPA